MRNLTHWHPSYLVLGRYCGLYLTLVLLMASPALAQSVRIPVAQPIITKDGLLQSVVPAIVQDKKGVIRTARTLYRYQLVGLSQGWGITEWSLRQYSLFVTIQPPWWRSWWAWLGYALLAAGSGWAINRYRSRRQQDKQRMQQQQEAEQLRQIDELKNRFFSNITHDLLTPLTLILGSSAGLISELGQSQYGERLRFIERNAQHLLTLINQLMDLSRLDANRTTLDLVRGQPDKVVGGVVDNFADVAAESYISLTYQTETIATYWFDADKLARITTNLLDNAIKFTPSTATAPGQITVLLRANTPTQQPGLYLSVADTGVGIDLVHFPHLFNWFYRVDTTAPSPGSGIGLALVNELIELLGGTIDVNSQVGQGTTFHVYLPCQLDEPYIPGTTNTRVTTNSDAAVNSPPEPVRVLLVEDNEDMAQFIALSFPDHYQLYRASDGEAGLIQANQLLPDLIISDIMMPGMDGFTFCERIKSDPVTDHIPVLLLTAKSTLADRMHGLQLGADDYLSKPFHVPELLARINNLLTRQRRYSERVQAVLAGPAPVPNEPAPPPAHPFIQRLHTVLDEHLDQTDFGVDELAAAVHLSRMQLHRKLKALTDSSTTEFIRSYRLTQSLALLTSGVPVAQAAYAVGFTNPAYFSQRFREQFGKVPSSYLPE